MPWNPDTYNQFKEKRYEPFYDLISHIHAKPGMRILDLGCGTGELTAIAAEKFHGATVFGVDDSAEMLSRSSAQQNLSFARRTIEEQVQTDEKWDLVIANASLQWVDDHATLFPAIINTLAPGGQLAVQMPSQKENVLNQLLFELVHEDPFHEILKDTIHHSPVLTLDQYTQLLFGNDAKNVLVYQKVYPIIAQSIDTLYDFISGSALVPLYGKTSCGNEAFFHENF